MISNAQQNEYPNLCSVILIDSRYMFFFFLNKCQVWWKISLGYHCKYIFCTQNVNQAYFLPGSISYHFKAELKTVSEQSRPPCGIRN